MAERYEYAYRGWNCKLTNKPCDLDGKCDECEEAYYQTQFNSLLDDIESLKSSDNHESMKEENQP